MIIESSENLFFTLVEILLLLKSVLNTFFQWRAISSKFVLVKNPFIPFLIISFAPPILVNTIGSPQFNASNAAIEKVSTSFEVSEK
jgi:hypothetical protein